MHMLRDEDGKGYRKLIRETIEFDPEILKRYVNFMSNPDEKTAVEQFGKGDKYFGVATVLATLPGVPMLGHGQIQGFGEKYGMEFRRAMLDEQPDPWLLERHEREIFPLLHRRAWFAEAHDFLLYDFVTSDGIDEGVLAYSNGSGPQRSLVLYQTRFATTIGRIHRSARFASKAPDGSKRMIRRTLADGLGLPTDPAAFVTFRDSRTGLEYVRSCVEIREHGLEITLDAYRSHVFWEFREVRDGVAGQWRRLAARLDGAGVRSLDESMRELQLEPVQAPLRAIFDGSVVTSILATKRTSETATWDEYAARLEAFYTAVAEATGVPTASAGEVALAAAEGTRTALDAARTGTDARPAGGRRDPATDDTDAITLLAWLIVEPMGRVAPTGEPAATTRAWYDELRLAGSLAEGLHHLGLDEGAAWQTAELVRVLLALTRPSNVGGAARGRDARLLRRWLDDPIVRAAIGINIWEGAEYVDRDRLTGLLRWAVRLDSVTDRDTADPDLVARVSAAAEVAGYRTDRLLEALGRRRTPAGTATRRVPSARTR
jgi:hypothetical protein